MKSAQSFLSDTELDELQRLGTTKHYQSGERIIAVGSTERRLYRLIKGVVRAEHSRVYQDSVLGAIGPGEFFGEIAYLDHGPASATVIAATNAEVLQIEGAAVDALADGDEGLSARLYRTLAVTLARRLRNSAKK